MRKVNLYIIRILKWIYMQTQTDWIVSVLIPCDMSYISEFIL